MSRASCRGAPALAWALVALWASLSSSALAVQVPGGVGVGETPLRVGILRSGELEAYTVPAEAFREALAAALPGVAFEEGDMGGDRERGEALVRGMRERGARLLFAVGAKAAWVAALSGSDVPVVFTGVLNWSAYRGVLGRPHVAGVALEAPAYAQLAQLKLVLPRLERVVVITPSARRGPALEELEAAGRRLKLEVVALPRHALSRLSRYRNAAELVTAVHPLPHPTIYTRERILQLLALQREHRLPLLVFSERFVEAGAAAAVASNPRDLGAQAAVQAAQLLLGTATPSELGVAPPVGNALALNGPTLRAMGVRLPPELVAFADRVHETEAAPPREALRGPEAELLRSEEAEALAEQGRLDPWFEPVSELGLFTLEEEIVHVASRRTQAIAEAPAIVSVLTEAELRVLGVRRLAEALALLPGMTVRYTRLGRYELLVRGHRDPSDVLVMLDGQHLNSDYDGAVPYDLPIEHLRRIEVIRGPGSALYGANAFAAVVSVLTQEPSATQRLSAGGLAYPTSRFHAESSFGGTLATRNALSLDGWDVGLSLVAWQDPGARMPMPLDLNGPFPPGALPLLDDAKGDVDVYGVAQRRGLLAGGDLLALRPKLLLHRQGPNFGPGEVLATDSRLDRSYLLVPLDYSLPLGNAATGRVRLEFDRLVVDEDVQVRPGGFTDRANPLPAPEGLRDRTAYTLDAVALEPRLTLEVPDVAPLWREHVLTLGVRGEHAWLSDYRYGQNYFTSGSTRVHFGNFSPALKELLRGMGRATEGFENYDGYPLRQRGADRWVLAGYAESQLQLPPVGVGELALTAGARLDHFSEFRPEGGDRITYTTLNPRGALVWRPLLGGSVRGASLKLAYGTAFRAPTFQERYDATRKVSEEFNQLPNEELRPQTTQVLELGLEARPVGLVQGLLGRGARAAWPAEDLLTLRANLYRMQTDDRPDLDPTFAPTGKQVINFPGLLVRGLELELQARSARSDFLFLNFSSVRARQLGTCVRPLPDGACPTDRLIRLADLRELPARRISLGAAVRPVGLTLELLRGEGSALYRALEPLQLSAAYRLVGRSRNNARTTFEAFNFAFVHPGYDSVDVGLTYPLLGDRLLLQGFVYNLLDQSVADPLTLRLEPRPALGYFLPRPGRFFQVRLEWRYELGGGGRLP